MANLSGRPGQLLGLHFVRDAPVTPFLAVVRARNQQMLRNYQFFDAPVGLLISLDRRQNTGSYMDLGMFIQNILLAARGQGLHTCAQAAFAWYHQLIREHLPLSDNDILVCGIALGHEDREAPDNSLETPREPVENFASFHGFTTD